METCVHLCQYLADLFLEWEIVENCREKQVLGWSQSTLLCSVTFLFFETRAVRKIMRKNASEPDRLQMTI
jgi:hypothetical protein